MSEEKEIINITEASTLLNINRRYFRTKFLDTGLIPILDYTSLKRPLMLRSDVLKYRNNSRVILNKVRARH